MIDLKTFDECIEMSDPEARHLLLGNGFSLALFPEAFSYDSICSDIDSSFITYFMEKIGGNDIEYLLRKLDEALEVLKYYSDNDDIESKINEDKEEIKKDFIETILERHPRTISSDKCETYYKFFEKFSAGIKYTVNYDLLIYWIYMKFKDSNNFQLEFGDGFSRSENYLYYSAPLAWNRKNLEMQNFHYLHGALHIFDRGCEIQKEYFHPTEGNITEKVSACFNRGEYSLFISEGSAEHKKRRIYANEYLRNSFESLGQIEGDLFIFGHSLRTEDNHIFEIINENLKIFNIFISLYKDDNPQNESGIKQRVEEWKNQYSKTDNLRKYYLYDANSILE